VGRHTEQTRNLGCAEAEKKGAEGDAARDEVVSSFICIDAAMTAGELISSALQVQDHTHMLWYRANDVVDLSIGGSVLSSRRFSSAAM
jgi:hypothetical protein